MPFKLSEPFADLRDAARQRYRRGRPHERRVQVHLPDCLPETLRQLAYRDANLCLRFGIVTVSHINFDGKPGLETQFSNNAARAAIDSGVSDPRYRCRQARIGARRRRTTRIISSCLMAPTRSFFAAGSFSRTTVASGRPFCGECCVVTLCLCPNWLRQSNAYAGSGRSLPDEFDALTADLLIRLMACIALRSPQASKAGIRWMIPCLRVRATMSGSLARTSSARVCPPLIESSSAKRCPANSPAAFCLLFYHGCDTSASPA